MMAPEELFKEAVIISTSGKSGTGGVDSMKKTTWKL